MNYTMPEWILLITAIGAMLQGVINSWRSSAKLNVMAASAAETKTEISNIAKTAEVTLGHVNSAATKATAEKEALIAERESLKATIEDMKRTAALLAQALAASQVYDRRSPPAPPSIPITDGLPTATLPLVIKEEDLPLKIDKQKK